ncbi:MAG: hypothetical protein WCN98_07375 [Verrucomicrobiaceae bacterium]
MSDFDDIQKLIRLKRHEQPPQGFVDEFVTSLQERQRSELLQGSARGLLWERVTTYFEDLLNPKWAWAGAAAMAIFMAAFMMRPGTASQQIAQNTSAAKGAVESVSISTKDDLSGVQNNLISHHYGGGFADEQNVQPVSFTQPFQGGVQNAGFKGDLEPTPAPQR